MKITAIYRLADSYTPLTKDNYKKRDNEMLFIRS